MKNDGERRVSLSKGCCVERRLRGSATGIGDSSVTDWSSRLVQ